MSLMLSREEAEIRLERGLFNKMVKFETIQGKAVVGKVSRVSVSFEGDDERGEIMIVFMLRVGDQLRRYECDLGYFNENTEILYGDYYTGDRTDVWRILKGD